MNQVHGAKSRMVREADGFEGAEHAALTALILCAIFAAAVSLGIALNGDFASLTQVVRF